MEILKRFLGGLPEQEKARPRLGYLWVQGISYEEPFEMKKVFVPRRTPIWVHSTSSIDGDVPGDCIGLIETSHDPIKLLIDDPTKYSVSDKVENKVEAGFRRVEKKTKYFSSHDPGGERYFEFWIAGEDFEEEEISNLNRSRQNANYELVQDEKRITDLVKQLIRLQVGQTDQATKLLSDLKEKERRLKETALSLRQDQDEAERELGQIVQSAAKQLTIRSLNGDISLTIQDPNLEVVISDEYSQRDSTRKHDGGESVVVRGKPPLNPTRKVSVFTFRGKISIHYPDIAA